MLQTLSQAETQETAKNRWPVFVLVILLLLLQFRLWFGKNNLFEYADRQQEIQQQEMQNANLIQRNALLKADIEDLTLGLDAIEERARNELGLIKQGETFYRILPAQSSQ